MQEGGKRNSDEGEYISKNEQTIAIQVVQIQCSQDGPRKEQAPRQYDEN